MPTWKFVHVADIHLDSPMLGLEHHESAPVARLRGVTRRALENLVTLCIEEDAQFVLIAGDLYDGDWRDYNTGLFFVRQIARLREAGIRVFLIRGNHDADSVITRKLTLPENTHEFSTRRAESVAVEALNTTIHGRSYGRKAVTDDLSAGYPTPVIGQLNIGLLHTSADGREGHERYAPCSVEGLVARGYDYWALGHVHNREILHEDPWVVFPGNLQGRHMRETGPKGCLVVTVEDGAIAAVDFRSVDVLRWGVCELDVSSADSAAAALDLLRDELVQRLADANTVSLALRLRLYGQTPAQTAFGRRPTHWREEIRGLVLDLAADEIWIEQVQFDTRTPLDLETLRHRDDPIGGLLRSIHQLRTEDPERLSAVFDDLLEKLPGEVREGTNGFDLTDPDTLRGLLDEAELLLVARLVRGDDA